VEWFGQGKSLCGLPLFVAASAYSFSSGRRYRRGIVLLWSARKPSDVLLLPVVLLLSAETPVAVFALPVVLLRNQALFSKTTGNYNTVVYSTFSEKPPRR
jgi:hypothetical protein